MEAGRVELTDHEREWVALTIADVFTPLGMDFDAERGGRLLEARLAVILAARGERGYHEGWAMRAGLKCNAPDCGQTPGHMGSHRA